MVLSWDHRTVMLVLLLPALCSSHARSTGAFQEQIPSFPRTGSEITTSTQEKVPLPPSTSSVKCKCQTVETDTNSNIQSRSDSDDIPREDPQKEIEIQIFKSESDLRKSDHDDHLQEDSPNDYGTQMSSNFKSYRTSELFHSPSISLPEFMQLGKATGPFEGPRRRRRDEKSQIKESGEKNKNVFYVYPINYYSDKEVVPAEVESQSETGSITSSKGQFVPSPKIDPPKSVLTSDATNVNDKYVIPETTNFVYSKPVLPLDQLVENSFVNPSIFEKRNSEVDENQVDKFQNTDVPFKDPNPKPSSLGMGFAVTEDSNKTLTLQQALSQAWEVYGSDTLPPPVPPVPSSELLPPQSNLNLQNVHGPVLIHPQTGLPHIRLPINSNLLSDQFQRKSEISPSPWNNRITETPVSVYDRDVSQPGFFSSLLARYIDFEVNNHEEADFARKLLFAFFIGTLIAGWIVLGVVLGVVPFPWFHNEDAKKLSGSNQVFRRDTLDDVGNRVVLALDADWLIKLEEKVTKDSKGNFTQTVAKCCIRPTEESVECELVAKEKDKADKVFKCLSGLIYNFQFGVDEQTEVRW